MNIDYESRYFHGGVGSENKHSDERRNQLRDGDFGREYENRYKGHDGRNRLDYDAYQQRNEQSPYDASRLRPGESRSRRAYGAEDEMRGGYGYDADRKGNDRNISERNQGGYGSGRMGGYSGAAFGGSNYSAHGSFGGSPNYGSMSGGGGNMGLFGSKSGYGNPCTNSNSDRGVPNYGASRESFGSGYKSNFGDRSYGSGSGYGSMGANNASGNNTYKGYGSNNNRNSSGNMNRNSDRGGYTDYDPNNRWNS